MNNENEVTKKDSSESIKYLYLCDGHACPEEKKKCCFTQKLPPRMACMHTSDKTHAVMEVFKGIIPTRFDPLPGNPHILVERFDYPYGMHKDELEKWLDTKFDNHQKEKIESSESDD